MCEPRKHKRSAIFAAIVIVLLVSGCRAPTGTLELIAVGRKGLTSAEQSRQQHQSQLLKFHKAQLAALDSAFDNDVRLVAAGQLKTLSDQPVAFDAQWVISARKGYAAARSIMSEQMRSAQAAGAIEKDNIRAADEALEMAAQLTVLQWNVGERIKQQFLKFTNITGSFSNVPNEQDE